MKAPPPLAVYHSPSYAVRAQLLALLAMIPVISFPMWWGALADERRYDLVSFGLLNTAQMVGYFVTAILLLFAIRRINRSMTAGFLLVTMAATYLTIIFVRDISAVIVIFALKSAASAGVISLSTLYLGYTRNPDRQYAIGVTVVTVAQSVIVYAIPHLYTWVGNDGVQIANALCLLGGAAIAFSLPSCMPDVGEQERFVEGDGGMTRRSADHVLLAAAPIVLATLAFNTYNINVFSYSERIGAERGFGMAAIGTILSVTMLCGAIGSLAVMVVGKRFGRLLPVAIGAALGAISTILLMSPANGMFGYAIGLALFSIVWSMVQPYISAQTMAIDYTGRVVVASAPLIQFGGVGAAALVTWLSALYGVNGVLWFAMAAMLACPVFMALSIALLRPALADRLIGRWRTRSAHDHATTAMASISTSAPSITSAETTVERAG